jgi:transglutaminase-like putative cysteine protease
LSQVSPLPNEIESTTKADVRKYERGIRRQTHYTQVPIDTSPAIRALAKTLIGSENNVLKAVAKVEQYLKANYDYTLDLKRNEHLQPLDDFLFEQKRGHCEYFATAMAILLRAEGIGTRIVNGFLGGQWNRYGQYFAVAQGDAHSWLEVQLPMEHCEGERCTWSTHWVRRDPTPAGTGSPTEISLLSRLRAYTDAFRMRWYKHVIEYDLEQQAGLISTAQKAWKHLATPNTRLSPAELATRRKATWIVGGCLLALIICGIAYRRRRHQSHRQKRTKVSKTALIAVHLMDECLRLYERHGYIRQDHQTPREFLSDLTRQAAPGCPTVACIVDLYETLRFGLEDDQKTEIPSLLKALRQIEFPPVVNA